VSQLTARRRIARQRTKGEATTTASGDAVRVLDPRTAPFPRLDRWVVLLAAGALVLLIMETAGLNGVVGSSSRACPMAGTG